jgi:hypothetical protein
MDCYIHQRAQLRSSTYSVFLLRGTCTENGGILAKIYYLYILYINIYIYVYDGTYNYIIYMHIYR